jgi:hypothetical protein
MKKEFVPYEIALELKQLGFDEPCCANMFDYTKPHINTDVPNRIMYFMPNYSENFNKEYDFGVVGHKDIFVSIPLSQQAFRWLYKKTNKWIVPIPNDDKCGEWYALGISYKSFEQAQIECLKKLIEIAKTL